jgi:mono/diheme cytochrome c family protein
MRARLISASVLVALSACSREAVPAPPAAPPSLAALSYEAQQGKALYQHYCQICHGETGAGDGFNAFNLDPRPRDLGDPAFQKAKTDADLTDAVRRGGAGVGLSPLMPPWGHTLGPRQVDEVVLFIRTLRKTGT